jgi:hypothetical protein
MTHMLDAVTFNGSDVDQCGIGADVCLEAKGLLIDFRGGVLYVGDAER